jgi:hypothetical protein
MSTKMYNFRLPKEQWWAFAGFCREQYLAEHPMCQLLRTMAERGNGYRVMMNAVDAIVSDEWTVELQLFDEGDTWLIRPLERGHFFMNRADQWADGYDIEKVYYDTRSDVPPEDEKNKLVAEWVDRQIDSGMYLTFSLLNKLVFNMICLNALLVKK